MENIPKLIVSLMTVFVVGLTFYYFLSGLQIGRYFKNRRIEKKITDPKEQRKWCENLSQTGFEIYFEQSFSRGSLLPPLFSETDMSFVDSLRQIYDETSAWEFRRRFIRILTKYLRKSDKENSQLVNELIVVFWDITLKESRIPSPVLRSLKRLGNKGIRLARTCRDVKLEEIQNHLYLAYYIDSNFPGLISTTFQADEKAKWYSRLSEPLQTNLCFFSKDINAEVSQGCKERALRKTFEHTSTFDEICSRLIDEPYPV